MYAGLSGIALFASACAMAASPGSHGDVDASTHTDAARSIDARPLDASVNLCTSTATCQTAKILGTVSGDTGADTLSDSGYQAAWERVRVTENDGGVFGVPQNVTVRLTSPATASYNLFVYVNTGSDVLECTSSTGTATTSGTTDTVQLTWGETGTFSNGSDDSRNVSIEVRPVSGNCSAAQPWQLTVDGDT